MAWMWLVDWLTGKMVLVDVPATGAAPPPPSTTVIPVFFFMIPQ